MSSVSVLSGCLRVKTLVTSLNRRLNFTCSVVTSSAPPTSSVLPHTVFTLSSKPCLTDWPWRSARSNFILRTRGGYKRGARLRDDTDRETKGEEGRPRSRLTEFECILAALTVHKVPSRALSGGWGLRSHVCSSEWLNGSRTP